MCYLRGLILFSITFLHSCSQGNNLFTIELKVCDDISKTIQDAQLVSEVKVNSSFEFSWLFSETQTNCIFDCITGYSFTGNQCQSSSIVDSTFNNNGEFQLTTIHSGISFSEIIAKDNNIFNVSVHSDASDRSIVIQKISEDGIDTSYGTNGYSESLTLTDGVNNTSFTYLTKSYLDDDLSLFVSGYAQINSKYHGFLIKYNYDGTIDSAFGDGTSCPSTGGCVILENAHSGTNTIDSFEIVDEYIYLLHSQRDNSGNFYQILKLQKTNGQLVTSFGTSGVKTMSLPGEDLEGYALQVDGNDIYVVGEVSETAGSARKLFSQKFNSSTGSQDLSYGSSGIAIYDLPTDESVLTLEIYTHIPIDNSSAWMVVDPSDAGNSRTGWSIVKIDLKNASIDTSIDNDGYVNLVPFSLNGEPGGLMIFNGAYEKTKEKLYIGGVMTNSSSVNTYLVMRFDNDGRIDTSWQTNGIFQIDDQYSGIVEDISIDNFGRVLTVGTHDSGTYINRFIP